MKRILFFALSLLVVVSCSKFDDSAIWEELDKHEDRIVKLETLCNQMNTNITSLQTIIIALQNNDYVTNIAPIKEGDHEIGYTITFSKSGSITIYHGKDGENGKDGVNGADGKDGLDGQDGVNGKDGKDGYTPKIGVKQHIDGKYYWTLDGNFLLDDNGNMIPTTGEDGANGADGKDGEDGANGIDGKDGITPQLKIQDGYWYLSHDDGASWQKLGKATGDNGLDGTNGQDGDSIINSITQDGENVYFNLSDGTLIVLPKQNKDTIEFEDLRVKSICCRNWDTNYDGELSYSEAAAVDDIGAIFKGDKSIISFPELEYFTSLTSIPAAAFENCTNLWKIRLPNSIKSLGSYAFNNTSLYAIIIPDSVEIISDGSFYNARELSRIEFGNKLTSIGASAFNGCSLKSITFPNSLKSIGSYAFSWNKISEITIPENVTSLGNEIFTNCDNLTHAYCLPTIPPKVSLGGRPFAVFGYLSSSACITYVPEASLEAYKTAWGEWKNRIFPITK